MGTANLAAGTHNLVLILAQWSVGPAQPAGTLSASTTNNNVLVDAASTTTGAVPHIGSPKIDVASPGTLGIGFSISANLSANSFIQFKLPAENHLTTLSVASMSGRRLVLALCSQQTMW